MSSSPLIVNCPTCGTLVTWTSQQQWRPFCSERCRLIDLGAWADESHRLPVQSDNQGEESSEFNDERLLYPDDNSTKN